MSTVWTRCFYDRDSVADALVTSILQKHQLRKQHSVFWAHELWISEEYDLLIKCLTKAFLQTVPFEGGLDAWVQLKPTESSILGFLGLLLAQPVIQTCSSPLSTEKLECLLKKSSRSRMYLLLEGLPIKTALSMIPQDILKESPDLVKAVRALGKGLAWILSVCPNPSPTRLVLQWPVRKVGTLSARTFKTPKRRALFQPSPYGVVSGCVAWQRILKEAGLNFSESKKAERLVFETQEKEEAFYLQYFPDDIPDEWSVLEKEKGHI